MAAIIDIVRSLVSAFATWLKWFLSPRKVEERARKSCDSRVTKTAEQIQDGKSDEVSVTVKQMSTDNPVTPRPDLKKDIDSADEEAVNDRLKKLTESL